MVPPSRGLRGNAMESVHGGANLDAAQLAVRVGGPTRMSRGSNSRLRPLPASSGRLQVWGIFFLPETGLLRRFGIPTQRLEVLFEPVKQSRLRRARSIIGGLDEVAGCLEQLSDVCPAPPTHGLVGHFFCFFCFPTLMQL